MRMTATQFETILKPKLGDSWARADQVFSDYGEKLSGDVGNVLLHAVDQDKVETVLDLLQQHYQDHLSFQHPEIRGRVTSAIGNPTEAMFLRICEDTLGLGGQT